MKDRDVLRFLSNIKVTESGCWEWTGHTRKGYGIFSLGGKSVTAHRVMYELMKDVELSKEVELDHRCFNRKCQNPYHLEIVTGKQNTLRSMGPTAINARKMECDNGHEFTPENTYIRPDDGARDCRECARLSTKRKRQRERG